MKTILKLIRVVIPKLAIWLGYLFLGVILTIVAIISYKNIMHTDSSNSVILTEGAKAKKKPSLYSWGSDISSERPLLDMQIWQDGKYIKPIDGAVNLNRASFEIRVSHDESSVIRFNASENNNVYKLVQSGASINDITELHFYKAGAQLQFNESRTLNLMNDSNEMLGFSPDDYSSFYNARTKLTGKTYFIKSIERVDAYQSPNKRNFPVDNIYLSMFSYVLGPENKANILSRNAIKLEFAPNKSELSKMYIRPECLEALSPWGYFDYSIDCSKVDAALIDIDGNGYRVERKGNGFIEYSESLDFESSNSRRRLLNIGFSGGGTGYWRSVALLERESNLLESYKVVQTSKPGDRCNDGYQRIAQTSEGGFSYLAAATPFRLLNPLDKMDWRRYYLSRTLSSEDDIELDMPATLNDWEPYEHITNSATACFGWIENSDDHDRGFAVTGILLEDMKDIGKDDGSLEYCVNNWIVRKRIESDYYPLGSWLKALKELDSVCASR